jgi:hypothetical protein
MGVWGYPPTRGRDPAIVVLFEGIDDQEDPCMDDATGLAEALLGLDGFRVLAVSEGPDELVIEIETTVEWTACVSCGVPAIAHERMPVAIRDLACFGRPARLVWREAAVALRG